MRDPEKSEGAPNTENIKGDEGLPNGAKKFNDEETEILLQEMWDKEVKFFKETKICINGGFDMGNKNIPGLERFEVEISGHDSEIFKGRLYPRVKNNYWYRGIAVRPDTDNLSNLVIIFSGWMQPWHEYPPSPIVYTIGDVPDQTVRTVIQRYTTGMSEYLDRLRSTYP